MSLAAPRAAVVAALACAAGACAYFNAMYNAEHYARQAEAYERQGRPLDARSNWQLAAAHAETLVVHHPKSGWVARAELLRGRALVNLGDYSGAELALQDALRRRLPPEARLEALGLMGRTQLFYQQLDSAASDLDSAATSRVQAVRDAALLDRGKVWLALGRSDSARAVLARSTAPEAAFDRAAVEVSLGDTAAAGATYDALAGAKRFDETEWLPALDSLAAAGDGAHASRLVARLVARRDCGPGAAARLLLAEGARRLAAGDTTAAQDAWRQVRSAAGDSVEGQAASVALSRLAIATAGADSELARPREALVELSRSGGGAGRDAASLLALLTKVDALGAARDAPDAHWFLRAELLRDSLGATRLAAADFAAMASRFPDSPWTPKALIAAVAAGYPGVDSLRDLLLHRYAQSPYVVAAAGGEAHAATLARLEDSLQLVLVDQPVTAPERAEPGAREEGIGAGEGRVPGPPGARPVAAPTGVTIAPPTRPPYGPPGPELP
jgi:predicted negative regulator of RcsB-dependent stress response